ncbi:SigB/SigF/SigG family RNA polymerase sigma factor [Streptomyces sp. NPDC059740]|uniref:SigB/SigF/SigG family RNA polymerase sigma factor n=1 Tax=Streptomyces sp. NPDC059740 TaxID=3346926 RepID=UPI00366687A6
MATPAVTAPTTSRTRRRGRSYDDAPDTAGDFARLATLPEGPERARLRRELIQAWMPMAERLALRFRNRGETVEDLRQVAALGLVKAVDRFDPERSEAFESFAVPTITGEIKRHFRDCMWDVHVPRRAQELRNKVRLAVRELSTGADERVPTVPDLTAHTGLPEEDVLLGLEALNTFRSMSLDAPMGGDDDGFALLSTLGGADPGYEQVVRREAVKSPLGRLPERERRILYLRFFCDMTQDSIAAQLGISQMHVSRLLSRACARIRAEVENGGTARRREDPHPVAA